MRAIDATALQRHICGARCGCEPEECGCEDCQFERFLSFAPTLDVAPVRHGRWVRCKGKSTLWHCSECGERIVYNPTRKTYNVCKKNVAEVNQFCRACGAKMDAVQEGENNGENMDG